MQQALIKLSFRQIINAESKSIFEKNILNVSYNEFLLKSQTYNMERKFSSFREMVSNDGRANSLHYKLSFPVLPYIDLLDKKIPSLKNNAGKNILFDNWQFELIDSDINNKQLHTIAINYNTDVFTLIAGFGEYMLLAYGDKFASLDNVEDSFVLKMQDALSITMYQQFADVVDEPLPLPNHNQTHL